MSQITLAELKQELRTPVGSLVFGYESGELTNPTLPGRRIFDVVAGDHIFRIQRTDDLLLEFYYASPGTGTRVATIDLKKSAPFVRSLIYISWSPQDISFAVEPEGSGDNALSAKGVPAAKNLRVGRDGAVYELGGKGVEVMEVRLTIDGKAVLRPTALDAWNATVQAVMLLDGATSNEGYQFEVVVTNLTISALVTGFEAYLKTRFLELERGGIRADIEALIETFYSRHLQTPDLLPSLRDEAAKNGVTVLEHIVNDRRINFQDYDGAKTAYSNGYDLRFAELNFEQPVPLRRLLKVRHRIVHVSPSLSVLNEEDLPGAEPWFPNRAFRAKSVTCFKSFIEAMHARTLELKRR